MRFKAREAVGVRIKAAITSNNHDLAGQIDPLRQCGCRHEHVYSACAAKETLMQVSLLRDKQSMMTSTGITKYTLIGHGEVKMVRPSRFVCRHLVKAQLIRQKLNFARTERSIDCLCGALTKRNGLNENQRFQVLPSCC